MKRQDGRGTSRVVIADDHPFILAGVRELIEQDARFRVVAQVSDSAALMRALHTQQPDILITDYLMPGDSRTCDGSVLIGRLHRAFPSLPILVLTMITTPWMIDEMYRVGAHCVITKSGDPAELLSALTAARMQRTYRSNSAGRSSATTAPPQAPRHGLSPRELEVVRLFSNGQTVSDIAARFNRSRCTVSAQKASAKRKLGTRSDQELVALGLNFVGMGDQVT
ncbi:response regulator transcription factor [Stenotrophomonas sp. TWI1149]|uniref:response regulator transcription factor n=1 Tax=unclassified Stenotrophomonas TaxID=196198 RepID=UPI0032083336